MQLNMLTSMISSDQFDSAILRPLRVQTMGSVVVRMIPCILGGKYLEGTFGVLTNYFQIF